jgi:hypothetical protein
MPGSSKHTDAEFLGGSRYRSSGRALRCPQRREHPKPLLADCPGCRVGLLDLDLAGHTRFDSEASLLSSEESRRFKEYCCPQPADFIATAHLQMSGNSQQVLLMNEGS